MVAKVPDNGLNITDLAAGDDFNLTSDGAVISFGADGEIKLTHVADTGLTLKHTATADDKPIVLTLQTGETDMAANDVIGKIAFQAPDEGTGTDAILVSGAIQAVAEGDHSSSSNATRLEFMTGSSEAATSQLTISSGGIVGIGAGVPGDLGVGLHIKSSDASASTHTSVDELVLENNGHCGLHIISANDATGNIYWGDDGGTTRGYFQYNHDGDEIAIGTGGSTAITFASTGTAKITTTGVDDGATGDGDFPAFALGLVNSHSDNANGLYYKNTGGSPDNSSHYMILCQDSTTNRFLVDSEGDCKNHDNSFGAISDERIKSNIADANSQWNDIKALKVRNFERKDDITQYGSGKKIQIGVVAQEVAAVSPGLVKEAEPTAEDIKMSSEFGTLNEDGTIKTTTGEKVKSVSYSVLYMKAIKALQEAMARIEALEAK